MPVWDADVLVDEPLVRRLLSQFPDLAVESLKEIAAGWDNSVWLVDGAWAFRFPRREIGIPGVEREIAILPQLAPLVSLPIPEPAFVGHPAHGYPWPFFGARHLPGAEAWGLPEHKRVGVAETLGAFLRRLHALDVEPDLPVDFNRRADMSVRAPRVREQLAEVERLGIWVRPPLVDELLEEAEELPPATEAVLVHGDLHFRHLLVDDEGALSGVIDWGDVCRADRAVDLLLYWSYFPPAAGAAFLDAYGDVSAEQLLRARVLALSVNAALAAYGHAEGPVEVGREAVAGLDRIAG